MNRVLKPTLVIAIAAALAVTQTPAMASPGDADPGFSEDGFADVGGSIRSLAVQSDGKTVAALMRFHSSGYPYIPGTVDYVLTRLNGDGSVDTGFGQGGIVELPGVEGALSPVGVHVALQSDDRILVTKFSPRNSGLWVARFDEFGRPDTSFGGGDGEFTQAPLENEFAYPSGLAVTATDQILVTGYVSDFDNGLGARSIVARLDRDGQLDPTFSDDGIVEEYTDDGLGVATAGVVTDSQGRVLTLAYSRADRSIAVVRYSADGARDSEFSADGVASLGSAGAGLRAEDLAVDSQNRAVVSTKPNISGSDPPARLVRLTAYGDLDTTFGQGGVATSTMLPKLNGSRDRDFSQFVLDAQDRPIFAARDYAVISGRMTTAGSMDAGYSHDGWAPLYRRGHAFYGHAPVDALVVAGDRLTIGAGSSVARLELSDGPADADGDARSDSGERCPLVFGSCPPYERRVRLRWTHNGPNADTLRGTVTLSYGVCEHAPMVKLFRVQRGADELVARLVAGRSGFVFGFRLERRPGRYYARVRRTYLDPVVCTAARSNLIHVNGAG